MVSTSVRTWAEAAGLEIVEAHVLLAVACADEPAKPTDIAALARLSFDDVYPALHHLAGRGFAVEERRLYRLTDGGREVVAGFDSAELPRVGDLRRCGELGSSRCSYPRQTARRAHAGAAGDARVEQFFERPEIALGGGGAERVDQPPLLGGVDRVPVDAGQVRAGPLVDLPRVRLAQLEHSAICRYG